MEIDGKRYRRLEQPSSAIYFGRWGAHEVDEPLYREVGVHNGRTIKPIERRVGMIARRMTPDLARTVGELSARDNSRDVEVILRCVGMLPPSCAVLEKRTQAMASELAEHVEQLEQEVRQQEPVPAEVAAGRSPGCGDFWRFPPHRPNRTVHLV